MSAQTHESVAKHLERTAKSDSGWRLFPEQQLEFGQTPDTDLVQLRLLLSEIIVKITKDALHDVLTGKRPDCSEKFRREVDSLKRSSAKSLFDDKRAMQDHQATMAYVSELTQKFDLLGQYQEVRQV